MFWCCVSRPRDEADLLGWLVGSAIVLAVVLGTVWGVYGRFYDRPVPATQPTSQEH